MSAALHILPRADKPVTDFPSEGGTDPVHLDNSQHAVFDLDFAEMLRQDYPATWSKGGNVLGNTQYRRLRPVAERGGEPTTETEEEAIRQREAWAARHTDDFRLPGIVAQVKWLVVGSRGAGHMKRALREAMEREDADRAAAVGNAWHGGATLLPPADVRDLAERAAATADAQTSLADLDLAARIAAGIVTRDDLRVMADESAGLRGGGAAGALWAAEELQRLAAADPFAMWFGFRAVQQSDDAWRADYLRLVLGPGERRMMADVMAILREWRDGIVARVPKVLGATLPEGRALADVREIPGWLDELLSMAGVKDQMRADLGADLLRTLEISFRRSAAELAIAGKTWAPVIDPARQQIGEMITRVTQTTIDRVAQVVTEAIAEGASVNEIQRRLMADPAFGRARALTIARTETARVATTGTREALRQATMLGVEVEQRWVHALDAADYERRHDLTRPATIPVGGTWTLYSGVTTEAPGHSGVAGEDINCRCGIRPVRKKT